MKIRALSSVMAAALVWLGSITVSHAQEPVSTGTVLGLVPAAGTLTIRSDQTSSALTFYGMERANIFTSDGGLAVIDNVQPGMPVTVQYAVRGNCWYVSKVILPEERIAPPFSTPLYVTPLYSTPRYLGRALNSRAARDNDITTQPGSMGNGPGIQLRRRNP